jgi:uncharacterized damage-inducible protein DinB
MTKSKLVLSALILLGLTVSAFGAHHKSSENLSTFQQVFLKTFGDETDKLVSLAEAFSEKGLEWRPAEGIRSVREAILHAAGANYYFGSLLGKEVPEGLNPRGFEKSITGKAETIAALKESIKFAKAAVSGASEESLNENIKLFGSESPRMTAVMIMGGHTYEHLGQLIAYARSYGVVPPWSQ